MLMRFTTSWPGATPGKTSLAMMRTGSDSSTGWRRRCSFGVGPLRFRADDQSSPPGAQDAPRQPLQRDATVAVLVCQLVGSPPPGRRAPVPGTLQDRTGRGDRVRILIQGRARNDLRRDERVLLGVELDHVVQTVCRHYGVDRSELARRGSRSPARAALAFLARKYTEATLADLVPVLGVSRPESVPNLTRRFSTWLESQNDARQDLKRLQTQLGLRDN